MMMKLIKTNAFVSQEEWNHPILWNNGNPIPFRDCQTKGTHNSITEYDLPLKVIARADARAPPEDTVQPEMQRDVRSRKTWNHTPLAPNRVDSKPGAIPTTASI